MCTTSSPAVWVLSAQRRGVLLGPWQPGCSVGWAAPPHPPRQAAEDAVVAVPRRPPASELASPRSPAAAQQRGGGCAAGRLRDPRAAAHAAQPGDPVRLAGPLRGGRAPLQAGPGGPGEDLGPRPPRRGHHAEHPGLGVQASTLVLFSSLHLDNVFNELAPRMCFYKLQ